MHINQALGVLFCGITTAVSAAASSPDTSSTDSGQMEEMLVWGRDLSQLGKAQSASQGLVGYADISTRPLLRVGELVEVMPGMVATQHSGSGKANQYFLRGMNLDHGTDFSVHFEGVPVNFRTHAHGQGYLDINFIIPELVETIAYRKGTYYADVGDFSAAGTAAFKTYDRLDKGFAEVSVGEDGYQRLVAADSVSVGQGTLLWGGELQYQDGPWELEEDVEKVNALLKYTGHIGKFNTQFIATAYSNSWNSTDQIPLREVQAGRLSRFGFIDPDLGGKTNRYSLIAKASSDVIDANLYGVRYHLDLFSNPTYFLEDRINGDEIVQVDRRDIYGGSLHYQDTAEIFGLPAKSRLGVEFRYDDIDKANLYQTISRRPVTALIDDSVEELSTSVFAETEIFWNDQLRTTAGIRYDYYNWDVSASAPGSQGDSGSGSDSLVSPKFSMAYAYSEHSELYASYGRGFHSNDVRGVEVQDNPVEALVKIDGAELGWRTEVFKDIKLTIAAFYLDTDSELIFVGDAGTTEPSDGAKRIGIELEAFWQISDWLVFDITAAKTRARFKDLPSGQDHVPDAHEVVAGAGLTATMPNGFTGSLRVRHFGEAPLDEADSVSKDSTTLVNLGMSYETGPVTFGVDVLNLFDSQSNDIEFLFESQLQSESAPVEDRHFHPVAPRSLRASIRYQF